MFKKFNLKGKKEVTKDDFKSVMKADPFLFEIFTLLNQGISDTIISLTIEEDQKMTFLKDIKYIRNGLQRALNDIDPISYPVGNNASLNASPELKKNLRNGTP